MYVRFSTLQWAVDYLRPNAGTDKLDKSAERTAIEGLFRWAHESDEDVLGHEEVARKEIRVEALDVENEESEESTRPNPEFFRPMSTKALLSYRLSDENEATQQHAAYVPRVVKDLADIDDDGALDFFSVHLAWEFGFAIRSNIPKIEHGFRRSLEKISAWGFRNMIPGAYIPVDQIPMTTTNKTDRRALRELGNAQTLERLAKLQSHGQRWREPSTEMEKKLQALWSSVLGMEPASISADSNFLRIGGGSIAAMRLVAAGRSQGLVLNVAQIFKAPRLSQLALLINQQTEEDEASQPQPAFSLLKTKDHKAFVRDHVEPFLEGNSGPVKDVVPCTDFQKCAVLDALQNPPGRLPVWIFGLPHNVDFARLEWACRTLVSHFDILQASFVQAGGRFWQVFLDGFKPLYETLDVDGDVESFTRTICEDDLKRPRQLGRSFIRFMAIRHQGRKHRLVFRIAHAQFDGYTWGMMIQALAALYHQQPLPTQPSFRQLIAFNESKNERSLSYWTSRLRDSGHPTSSTASPIDAVYSPSDRMTLTTSFPMPNVKDHDGISGATFFHAACAIALSQQSGQANVVFGRLVTGRSMLPGSLQNVVGPAMTEVPIIASISPDDSIVTIAQRLQAQFIDGSAHESAGMEEIIQNCTDWPEHVVDFGWRTAFQQEDEMEFKFLDSDSTISVHEHDLLPRGRPEIYATPRNGRLHLEFEGNRLLISEHTVREVFCRIERVLGELTPSTLPIQDGPVQLTFVGGGHLAQAIISGILSSSNAWTMNCDMAVTARRLEHVQELQSRYPQLLVTGNNLDQRIWQDTRISRPISIVLLCTRPADIPTVSKQLAPTLEAFDPAVRPTVVTMCPGITVSQLQDWLPPGTAIVRSMPNTPVEVQQGATGLFASGEATSRVNDVQTVLEEVSPLVTIVPEESKLDVVAAISGSGPAHFFFVIESMVAAAESMGLSKEAAEPLVIQSCLGAGFLAKASSKPVTSLRKEVCVPGGSTEKAISHLNQDGIQEIFKAATQKSLDANQKMRFC